LEQWAIEALKNVAKKMGVSEDKTVTKEHVVALIAFAMGEGGDIMNNSIFNPLNTGIDAPNLVDGAHSGSGLQAFKSFDAGVEGVARTIVRPQYSRLSSVLIKPGATAKQFMYALTYFNKYPGNALWAGASVSDPDGYYQGRLALIEQVRSNYKGTAGLVIGTPQHEQALNITKPELLKFSGGGDVTLGSCSNGSADAASIAQQAIKLAWPDSSHGTTPKPSYAKAIDQYNSGLNPADCGVFVATVMRSSGADPDYPASGTSIQAQYVRDNPDKYDVVDKVRSMGELQPGDILIVNQGGGAGANGHTYIFVGNQPPHGYNQASASLNSRAGNLGGAVLSDGRGDYMRARLK
jgi:cell wall-associated NlpC family hydrolase